MHTYSLKSHSPRTIYSLIYSLRTTKSTNVLRLIATGMMYPKSFRCKSGAWKNLIFSDWMFSFLPTFYQLFAITLALLGSWQMSKGPLSPSMSWRGSPRRWCTSSPSLHLLPEHDHLPHFLEPRKLWSWLDRWSCTEGRKIACWGGAMSENKCDQEPSSFI